MKYLKITMTLFAITLCLSLVGVNATTYFTIQNITIPSMSTNWTSQQADKGPDGVYQQKVKKISCVDDLSGDGRALSGRILFLFGSGGYTDYKPLPQGTNVSFGSSTVEMGAYKLQVKSDKKLLTTATASLNWDIGSLYDPSGNQPYPVKGL